MELGGRSQGFWVGLAVALAAGAICLCALPTSLWIATGRGGWLGGPAGAEATQAETGPSMQTPGQMPPTKPTSSAAAVSNAGVVWPLSNVPMPAEADLGTLLGSSEDFSVITDQDFGEVLAFYQDEMEALGWTKVSYGTRITEDDAELQYRNDENQITVMLARIPFIGTLVEIRLGEP